MVRSSPRWFMLFVAVLTLLGSLGPAAAQEATPPSARPAATPEAVTFRTLASGTLNILAPGTATLAFGRVTVAPGATVPLDPTDPSATLVYMSSGAATFRVEAEIPVARGARAGTPGPTAPEVIPAGTEFTLNDGDSALLPPMTGGELRNDGAEPAVAWVATVAVITEAAATPTP